MINKGFWSLKLSEVRSQRRSPCTAVLEEITIQSFQAVSAYLQELLFLWETAGPRGTAAAVGFKPLQSRAFDASVLPWRWLARDSCLTCRFGRRFCLRLRLPLATRAPPSGKPRNVAPIYMLSILGPWPFALCPSKGKNQPRPNGRG